MKIPFKPSLMRVRHKRPRFIILHHTVCQYPQEGAKIDGPLYQLPFIMNGVLEQKTPDINFHYIVEKIKDDYVVMNCRPFVYECDFPDIDTHINRIGIHVAVMGSYSLKVPEKRLFEICAYKLINPLFKIFNLTPNMIKTHSELSSNKELTCPGDFFEVSRLISEVKRFIIK